MREDDRDPLGADGPEGALGGGEPWPPEGAEELDTELLYERLAEAGHDYGPAFRVLRAAWRKGEEIYAARWSWRPSSAAERGDSRTPGVARCDAARPLSPELDGGELAAPIRFSRACA